MKYQNIILYILLGLSFLSCSSLKQAKMHEDRVLLDETNSQLIEGKYNINSLNNKASFNLMGLFFTGGYRMFRNLDYRHDSTSYIQFKFLDKKTLSLEYMTEDSEIKSTKIKGKWKNSYFEVKRSHVLLPFIFMNLYRNRKLRIGLLENGNLTVDFNQISLGTAMLIFPFYDNDKSFDVQFKRIE